jgi:flagellar protein FliJ
MAKFKFRLESVLKLKDEQKKELELELAGVREQKRKAENEFDVILQLKTFTLNNIHSSGKIQVMKCQADYYYLDSLEKQIDAQKNKIERIKKRENSVISDLLKISKEKKTIEKLKEKKRVAFEKEELHLENLFLDDISQRLKKSLKAVS